METIILTCFLDSPYWNLVNFLLAVFAAFIAVGYFFKPRLFYCSFLEDNKFKTKVINKNLIATVKDIQCEMAVSICKDFNTAQTLELVKDYTLIIRKYSLSKSNYTFKTNKTKDEILEDKNEKQTKEKKDYKYLRVRLLAPNFLGVKKAYERIYELEKVPFECDPKSQCYHNHQIT